MQSKNMLIILAFPYGIVAQTLGGYNVIFSIAAGVTAIGFTIYLLSQRKISKEIVIYT